MKLEIIPKVDVSEWGTPIVPVVKPSGALRVWGLQSDSQASATSESVSSPHPEELFATLNGGQKFTTLELSETYLQIELEEGAKTYNTINTYKGLYCFNRLPYSIASAPAIIQYQIIQELCVT